MVRELAVGVPSIWVLRASVAAVWMYEGLWCKLLDGAPSQKEVIGEVRWLGDWAGRLLTVLGVVETLLAVWVLSGVLAGWCAVAQVVLLVTLNTNGLLWARGKIHDPAGMVVKNAALLVLAWVAGTR